MHMYFILKFRNVTLLLSSKFIFNIGIFWAVQYPNFTYVDRWEILDKARMHLVLIYTNLSERAECQMKLLNATL
jgi:predicted GNAT superfamily acetyltransferase